MLTTVILGSTRPGGCLHCLVGGSSNRKKVWRQKCKRLSKHRLQKTEKNRKGPLKREAANDYWIAMLTLIWDRSFKERKKKNMSTPGAESKPRWTYKSLLVQNINTKYTSAHRLVCRWRAGPLWNLLDQWFMDPWFYYPAVGRLHQCTTGYAVALLYMVGPLLILRDQNQISKNKIDSLEYFKQHLLKQLLRLEATQQCFHLKHITLFFFPFRSFGQWTDQQISDGVLKVNRHYSGEDIGMNIWTVSGIAVCRPACQLGLHLHRAKISHSGGT